MFLHHTCEVYFLSFQSTCQLQYHKYDQKCEASKFVKNRAIDLILNQNRHHVSRQSDLLFIRIDTLSLNMIATILYHTDSHLLSFE